MLLLNLTWPVIVAVSSGTLRASLRTGPSLSNAHTPVQTVNAPSLPRMVLPVTLTFSASAHTLIAASGEGDASSSDRTTIPRCRNGLGIV